MQVDWVQTPEMLTQHVLDWRECRLHYWMGGPANAPLLVFLHGAGMDHRMFNAQVQAVVPHYRVLVWDARGHGKSQPVGAGFSLSGCADDLLAVLNHEALRSAILIGQSMGGMIAQYVYHRAPERVQAMIMIGSVNITFPYKRWEVLALKLTMPLFNLWPYRHFVKTVANNTALRPEVRHYARAAMLGMGRANFLTIWKSVSLAVDSQGIPDQHIAVPLLLTHGAQDTAGSIRQQAPQWAAFDPDVAYQVIPDAAHNANQDNPEKCNEIMLAFLQGRLPDAYQAL